MSTSFWRRPTPMGFGVPWLRYITAVVMDEPHLEAAVRYVAFNPVRAGLAERPRDWRWSSVHAHLAALGDGITAIAPILSRFPDFAAFIEVPPDQAALQRLRQAEAIGRPLGSDSFISDLEARSHRALKPAKRGPKPKSTTNTAKQMTLRTDSKPAAPA